MTTTNQLSLCYTCRDDASGGGKLPRFEIEPDPANPRQVQFSATNLQSVDRLDVRWSTSATMKNDPVKAYLAKIGAKGRAANTPAQRQAAKLNGKKGGRPKGAKDSKPRTRAKS